MRFHQGVKYGEERKNGCQRQPVSRGDQRTRSRGDARRVCLVNEEKHLLDIPLSIEDPASPANAIAAPVLAAIRAFGSLVNECIVEVEKVEKPKKK